MSNMTKKEIHKLYDHCFTTKLPTYNRWKMMKQRCNNEKHPLYKFYGGRGIKVHEEFNNSRRFHYYVASLDGYDDPNLNQIDRIDNDGDYEPGNLQWTTSASNVHNSRVATLDEHGVYDILRRHFLEGETQSSLSREYNTTPDSICKVCNGKTWVTQYKRFFTENPQVVKIAHPNNNVVKRPLSDMKVRAMLYQRYVLQLSIGEIHQQHQKVGKTTIISICKGHTYNDVFTDFFVNYAHMPTLSCNKTLTQREIAMNTNNTNLKAPAPTTYEVWEHEHVKYILKRKDKLLSHEWSKKKLTKKLNKKFGTHRSLSSVEHKCDKLGCTNKREGKK